MKRLSIILLVSLFMITGCAEKNEDTSNRTSNNTSNQVSNSNVTSNSNVVRDVDKSKIGDNKVTLYLFYSSTCPHCHNEIEWLDKIKDKYSYLNIVKTEATENMDFYEKVVEKMNINNYGVPLTIIGTDYVIGYSDSIGDEIINLIEFYSTFKSCDSIDTIKNSGNIGECININKKG